MTASGDPVLGVEFPGPTRLLSHLTVKIDCTGKYKRRSQQGPYGIIFRCLRPSRMRPLHCPWHAIAASSVTTETTTLIPNLLPTCVVAEQPRGVPKSFAPPRIPLVPKGGI